MACRLDRIPVLVAVVTPGRTEDQPPAPPLRLPRRTVRSIGLVLVVVSIVVLGSSLAGCTLDESGPPAAQLSAWMANADGGAAVGQVEVDTRNIDLAVSRHNSPSALRTVCALLTNDAQTAIGSLPTPDTQLTDELNAAYEEAAAAGNDCYQGSNGNHTLLRRSASERAKLFPMLTTAVHRIESITGHTPSTSTTAPSVGGNDPFGN